MNIRFLLLGVFSLLLAACAHPPPLATESGNPEVVISDVARKDVFNAIIAEKLKIGMQIKSANDYSVVFTKKDDSLAGSLIFGSNYDSVPEGRVTYNIVEIPGGLRIFSRVEMVTNPGSSFERARDMTRGSAVQMQAELESLRAHFAKPDKVSSRPKDKHKVVK